MWTAALQESWIAAVLLKMSNEQYSFHLLLCLTPSEGLVQDSLSRPIPSRIWFDNVSLRWHGMSWLIINTPSIRRSCDALGNGHPRLVMLRVELC